MITRLSMCLFMMLCLAPAIGQLCPGSTGDAVINITFGSGDGVGPALPTGSTYYTYTRNNCPGDGAYTIASSVINCWSNAWYDIPQDHTPNDRKGYMMVVNASTQPGDFYVQQISGLCEGNTYEFSAWILNLEKPWPCNGNPIKPNVTFRIETPEGKILMKYNTGDIPSKGSEGWTRYGSVFKLPAGTSTVIVRTTNNAAGGCGNDLILDDITFRTCGPSISAKLSSGATEGTFCLGDTTAYRFTAIAANNMACQWQSSTDGGATWQDIPGATDKQYTAPARTTEGVSMFRLTMSPGSLVNMPALCRIATKPVTVTVERITADAGPDMVIMKGERVMLDARDANTAVRYSWSPASYLSSPSELNPYASPPATIKYTLKVESTAGCGMATDDMTVTVLDKFTVPNAFSPNGDGVNDKWLIPALSNDPLARVSLFNQFGSMVHESKGNYQPWDGSRAGKPLPVGTYYYVIETGKTGEKYTGWVLIIK